MGAHALGAAAYAAKAAELVAPGHGGVAEIAWQIRNMDKWFIVRAAQDLEPQPWIDASLVSNSTLRLSAPELDDLAHQVMQLLSPYRLRNRPTPGPEDRSVQAALRFVPIAAPPEDRSAEHPRESD